MTAARPAVQLRGPTTSAFRRRPSPGPEAPPPAGAAAEPREAERTEASIEVDAPDFAAIPTTTSEAEQRVRAAVTAPMEAFDPTAVEEEEPRRSLTNTVPARGKKPRQLSTPWMIAIGMAVFFLFYAVEFGVRGLLEEREQGTLSRLLVASISPSSVIGGKALASLVVGLVSTSLLVFATSWLLDASWGDPLGVVLLVVCGVLAAVGVTALVAALATTTAQAGAYVSIDAVVGGLLGGTFFPISSLPRPLEVMAWLTPLWHGVTLCRDLTLGQVGAEDALHLAYLLALVGVGLVLARWSYRRRLVV